VFAFVQDTLRAERGPQATEGLEFPLNLCDLCASVVNLQAYRVTGGLRAPPLGR
jgi:hypothetical protein